MAETKKSVYATLSSIDMSKYHKTKGNITYLPWAAAWGTILEYYPDSTYDIIETVDGVNYFSDGKTAWVKTALTIEGITREEQLPVLDNRNNSLSADSITSAAVNKSIKRCLTKNCALFGLDLNLWIGEELSDNAKAAHEKKTKETSARLKSVKEEIITIISELIKDGVESADICAKVVEISGKKNPNAIQDVAIAEEVLEAVKAYKK